VLEIDPKCAVGILEAFLREKPDFGRAATFYVLPGAASRIASSTAEHEGRKLQYLVSHGYEIGNHTLWHANLGKYDEAVRARADRRSAAVDPAPRARIQDPHARAARTACTRARSAWALRGSAKGTRTSTTRSSWCGRGGAVALRARLRSPAAAADPGSSRATSPSGSPGSTSIRTSASSSDGDPATVTVPADRREQAQARPEAPCHRDDRSIAPLRSCPLRGIRAPLGPLFFRRDRNDPTHDVVA